MCGIIAYTGARHCAPLLLEALRRLEYRGYDSAGVAVRTVHGLVVRKRVGTVDVLARALAAEPLAGTTGIGHTRWATHGPPSERNAHPHLGPAARVAVVHNGIIDNADELRALVTSLGHECRSDTDSELLAHLVEHELACAPEHGLNYAVRAALRQVRGSYALALLVRDWPDTIVGVKRGSPLLLAVGPGECLLASDAAALAEHTERAVALEDGDLVLCTPQGARLFDDRDQPAVRAPLLLSDGVSPAERGDFAHHMRREIADQPAALQRVLRHRLAVESGEVLFEEVRLSEHAMRGLDRLVLLGCGTSLHAALVGKYLVETLAGVAVEVDHAGEFRYRSPVVDRRTLCVSLSQSGETADTLEAQREAARRGAKTVALVNVVGSTLASEARDRLYLHAGPEIGVASTKAFTSQVTALALLALALGRARGLVASQARAFAAALATLPGLVADTLSMDGDVEEVAAQLASASSMLFVGRHVNHPVALEGALKLKELSYIHAEGYPAAELKHGPLALVDALMPVVVLAPHDALFDKHVATIQEIKARRGIVVAVVTRPEPALRGLADYALRVPESHPLLQGVVNAVPLQLLAYHIAVMRGADVDRPRNLAKSVTVE